MNDKPLTGVRKRQQIQSANKQVLIWVAIAAAAVTVCIMVSMNFVQRIRYQAKVNSALSQTNSTLEQNVNTQIPELRNNMNVLRTDQNLLALRRDNMNHSIFQVVIDALPMTGDGTALGASLQQRILSNSHVDIEQISVIGNMHVIMMPTPEDDEIGMGSEFSMPEPQAMPFTITVRGNALAIQQMLVDIERTIRPIIIDNIDIQGTNDMLQVTIRATTFFIPQVNYQLGSKEIQP